MEAGLRFAIETWGITSYAVAVAAFNRRAIAVYERTGFREVRRYDHVTSGGLHEFVRMTGGTHS